MEIAIGTTNSIDSKRLLISFNKDNSTSATLSIFGLIFFNCMTSQLFIIGVIF